MHDQLRTRRGPIQARAEASILPGFKDYNPWRDEWPAHAPSALSILWETLVAWAALDPREVDRRRDNRVLFVDGERGVGKTTVLNTLLHIGKQARGAVRPTEVVHFYTANVSAPVLPQMVAPLARLFQDDEPPEEDDSCWSDLFDSLTDRFGSANRVFSSDPLSRRLEMQEELAAGYELEVRFRRYVDRGLERLRRRDGPKGELPLAVVLIDDGDLLPGPLHELTRGLRLLWHPRVVWMIASDQELFRHVLDLQVRQEVYGRTEAIDQQAPAAVRYLAERMFQRIVPPAHIVEVRAPSVVDEPDSVMKSLWTALDDVWVNDVQLSELLCLYPPAVLDALFPSDVRSRIDLTAMARLAAGSDASTRDILNFFQGWISLWRDLPSVQARALSRDLLTFLPQYPSFERVDARDHDVALSDGWRLLIPRTHDLRAGPFGARQAARLKFLQHVEQLGEEGWTSVGEHPLRPRSVRISDGTTVAWPLPPVRVEAVVDYLLDVFQAEVSPHEGSDMRALHTPKHEATRSSFNGAWVASLVEAPKDGPSVGRWYRSGRFQGLSGRWVDPRTPDLVMGIVQAHEFGGVAPPTRLPTFEWRKGWRPTRRDAFGALSQVPVSQPRLDDPLEVDWEKFDPLEEVAASTSPGPHVLSASRANRRGHRSLRFDQAHGLIQDLVNERHQFAGSIEPWPADPNLRWFTAMRAAPLERLVHSWNNIGRRPTLGPRDLVILWTRLIAASVFAADPVDPEQLLVPLDDQSLLKMRANKADASTAPAGWERFIDDYIVPTTTDATEASP